MHFQSKPAKNATRISFIEGLLTRFDGKTLFIGTGTEKSITRRKFVLRMRKVISVAKQNKCTAIALTFTDIRSFAPNDYSDHEVGQVAGTAFVMANYEPTGYKTTPKDGWPEVTAVAIIGASKTAEAGFARGKIIGAEVNACRELANTPGNDMTPALLAAAAKAAAKGQNIQVSALGVKEMKKLGMGAVLGVGLGSAEKPQFIVMEYWGANKKEKPVVLVGKGVTFDTGGLQVKPGDSMYEMHMDMSGGASVIHAVALAAKLKLKVNVVALVPAVENASASNAMRPGDILKSLSGKTIEILHTDAEGRVILADAITYAKRYNPAVVADVATLTGAALVALGEQASAFMTNEKGFSIADYMALAESSGDYMWPLPLWEEYDDMVKGKFADVPNISTAGNSRYGGVIAGGKFLEVFAKELDAPWIHIDMAPRMTSVAGEYLAKGAAGAPVRFLLALIEKHAH